MIIQALTIRLYAPFCHSLKEKRMIVQSIVKRVRNKFNVSASEVEDHDLHQSIVVGVAVVSTTVSHANAILNEVLKLVEDSTEAEVTDFYFEAR